MFVLVWTNEGQYGIINPDLFHNFEVHMGKLLTELFKLSAEIYDFRMDQKICASMNFWRILELFYYRLWRWYL